MLTNDQIFSALNSIYSAFEVIHHESYTAYKFANRFEKDVMRGDNYLQGFRHNMRARLEILDGLLKCVSRLVDVVMEPENTQEGENTEQEVKQCVGL